MPADRVARYIHLAQGKPDGLSAPASDGADPVKIIIPILRIRRIAGCSQTKLVAGTVRRESDIQEIISGNIAVRQPDGHTVAGGIGINQTVGSGNDSRSGGSRQLPGFKNSENIRGIRRRHPE